MPGVIRYVLHRVLKKGDAARRVLSDLKDLHNVEITISTINKWIKNESSENSFPTNFSQKGDRRNAPNSFYQKAPVVFVFL